MLLAPSYWSNGRSHNLVCILSPCTLEFTAVFNFQTSLNTPSPTLSKHRFFFSSRDIKGTQQKDRKEIRHLPEEPVDIFHPEPPSGSTSYLTSALPAFQGPNYHRVSLVSTAIPSTVVDKLRCRNSPSHSLQPASCR